MKEKVRELRVTCFELKLFRLVRSATGASDRQIYAIYTEKQWDMERELHVHVLLESSFFH